jgi:endonuclease G
MISPAKALVAILLLLGLLSPAAAGVLRLDDEGFAVWLDCERRSAVKFRYNAQRDHGNLERPSTFRRDPDAPERCKQTSTDAYQHPNPKYHRGHLVPANHLDYSETAMRQSHFMTNILPKPRL